MQQTHGATLQLQDAFREGPREKLAYIPAVQPREDKPNYLMTVDLDPDSKTYSQVRRVLATSFPRECPQICSAYRCLPSTASLPMTVALVRATDGARVSCCSSDAP